MRIIRRSSAAWFLTLLVAIASIAWAPAASATEPRPWSWFGTYITGDAKVGSELTCHPGIWTSAPTSYTYTWRRGTTVLGTGSTYTPTVADMLDYAGGQTSDIMCRVDATNASGTYLDSEWVSIAPGDGAPIPRSIPILRGALTVGSQLTCQAPATRNTPTSTTYAFNSHTGGQAASASDTYTVRDGDLGNPITCTVKVANASGGRTVKSESLPPTPADDVTEVLAPSVAATIIGGAVGQVATCNPGVWPSGTSVSYEWTVNYSPVATTATYTPTLDDQGDRLACRVTGTNGALNGSSYAQLDSIPAGAGTETSSAAPSISGTNSPGGVLTCAPGTWSGPPSGYQYAWVRDLDVTAPYGTASNAKLYLSGGSSIDYFGHVVRCAVRASNPRGWSDWSYSAPITIATMAGMPTNSAPPTISGTAANGSTLTCSPGTWANATGFAYSWQRADGSGFWARQQTLDVSGFAVGSKLRCQVAAVNGGDYGFTTASALVTIVDAPGAPTHLSAPTISGSGVVGEPLQCLLDPSDPAASNIEYVMWHVDGFFDAPGMVGYDTYYPTSAQVGRRITCSASLQNAHGSAFGASAAPGVLIVVTAGSQPPTTTPPPTSSNPPSIQPPAPTGGGDEDDDGDQVDPVALIAPKAGAIKLVGAAKFAAIASGSVKVRFPITQPGVAAKVTLTVSTAQATSLGIKVPRRARTVVIGTGTARAARAGTTIVTVKLTPATKSAFRAAAKRTSKIRSVQTTLTLTLTKDGLRRQVIKPLRFVR